VEEEHARVAPALGAYAAGALEPVEAAEVEAHLAAATAGLDELLAGLTAEQWRLPVIHGWDVDELLRHLAARQPAAGPDAALGQAFETWIHADDVRAALGRPPRPPGPAHLHGVLTMGVRLLPPALRALGVERPGRAVALRLEGPGGRELDGAARRDRPAGGHPRLRLNRTGAGLAANAM
jgi:hypothetical protein